VSYSRVEKILGLKELLQKRIRAHLIFKV